MSFFSLLKETRSNVWSALISLPPTMKAKYETLVARLDLAKAAGTASVVICCDSQVVINQIKGDYKCKGKRMKGYLDQVRRRVDELKAKIIQILRGENEQADRSAKAALAESMTTLDNVLSFV